MQIYSMLYLIIGEEHERVYYEKTYDWKKVFASWQDKSLSLDLIESAEISGTKVIVKYKDGWNAKNQIQIKLTPAQLEKSKQS